MARPSKSEYWLTDDGLRLVRSWKRNDKTDKYIAEKIGIDIKTLYKWKQRYAEFSDAFKKGREDCIADAEEALQSKFKPYTYEETQIETWEEGSGAHKTVKTHKRVIKKTALPDTTAIIFFLKCKAGWTENNIVALTAGEAVDNSFIEALGAKAGEDWANEASV